VAARGREGEVGFPEEKEAGLKEKKRDESSL
jgi:hypothetical protein